MRMRPKPLINRLKPGGRERYTLVYATLVHPGIYVLPPPLGRCTRLPASCTALYWAILPVWQHGQLTLLVTGLKERGLSWPGGSLLTLRINPSQPETGLIRQRNPLQRVQLHKDDEKRPTPPQVLPNPPQGPRPPFHMREREEATSCQTWGF